MAIRFTCSDCGVAIKAPTQRSGAQLPCPKCGATLTVPSAVASPVAADEATRFAHLMASIESSPTSTRPGTSTSATASPPPAAPLPAATPPAEDAEDRAASSQPPVVAAVSLESASKVQVRIVDIKLPFASVLRLGLQAGAVGVLGAIVVWIVWTMVAIVMRAMGVNLTPLL